MTKLKVGIGALVLLLAAGAGLELVGSSSGTGEDDEFGVAVLSVTQKRTRPEKGIEVLITYRSSDSNWRGPVSHKSLKPWNKSVRVRRGSTVYLEANQRVANELTCIISQPSIPGKWSKPHTRRSIGTVKCQMVVS